jgi:hypothetical protein
MVKLVTVILVASLLAGCIAPPYTSVGNYRATLPLQIPRQMPAMPRAPQTATWTYALPAKACPWSATDSNCHYSSPALADLNHTGTLDIIVATNNGHVVAIDHAGKLLWDVDVAPFFGMAAGTQEIASSPAVGDIDADGELEIAVGVGSVYPSVCTTGGVIVLDNQGRIKPGWPQLADDWSLPLGCRDTVFSTPALGDLDKDGKLEIVVGSFDMKIYAWRADGTLMPGFPPDGAHAARFPTEPELQGRLSDTIWSSPALGDLDRDGFLEIVIGSDEGNRPPGYSCPYRLPPNWRPDYCGGALYVLDRFGRYLPGFPKYVLDIIASSPALVDLDGDGWLNIVVGTGPFYYDNSPNYPVSGFRVYAWNHRGNDLPGWEGGKLVGGPTPASPSIGDLDGDGEPEIVGATYDPERKLYAWHVDGALLPGFPMAPTFNGVTYASFDTPANFILADYNGDGKQEIFFSTGWLVTVVDGTGQQLTNTGYGSPLPSYMTNGSLINNPAIGDLHQDGRLALIATNSQVTVWDLPRADRAAAWPLFRNNVSRTGSLGAIIPLPIIPHSARGLVERFYLHVLRRAPDQTGMDTWTNALLDRAMSGADLARAFVLSSEFGDSNTTNDDFLTIIYRAFFDRVPDADGYNVWLSALNNGLPRVEMLDGFIRSREFAELCDRYGIRANTTHQDKLRTYIMRLYREVLGRAPDAAGLAMWATGNHTGSEMARGFVLSQEFSKRAFSDEQFVTMLYRALLNRVPDSGGFDFWLANLQSGMSRDRVLESFIGSAEFAKLCESYGIAP